MGGGSSAGVRLPEREDDDSFACSEEVNMLGTVPPTLYAFMASCVCGYVFFVRTAFLFNSEDVLRMFGKKKKKELIRRLQRT